jgi:predicted AAA+ superfamily ATPase
MYPRILDFKELLKHRSIFLFGPRRTGKSTYLSLNFPDAVYYDLLNSNTFRELSSSPELIRQRITDTTKIIIIDEVQKLPNLLDEVHLLIEKYKDLRFILTGSSIRKLRRGSANLLAGRALTVNFHPLVYPEIKESISLQTIISKGSLPFIQTSPIPDEDIKAYVGDYLKEEIYAEFEARKLESFSRFLEFAAKTSGHQVNFTSIGQELGINPKTVKEYFQVCQDTLIGYVIDPLTKISSRKVVTTGKFYLFDYALVKALLGKSLLYESLDSIGIAYEHFILNEIISYKDYLNRNLKINFYRTYSKFEVDFILNQEIGIEVKSSSRISKKDTKGLRILKEEIQAKRLIIVCNESMPRVDDDGIEILPFADFLNKLWSGQIV